MSDISVISAATDPTLLAGKMAPVTAMSMKMGTAATDARIDKTAQDFESVFATEMLRPMFEGIDVDKTFGGGHGEEVMRSFMLQEYGKIIAKTDKLGIASQVKAEMIRLQGGAKGHATTAIASGAYQSASNRNGENHVAIQ